MLDQDRLIGQVRMEMFKNRRKRTDRRKGKEQLLPGTNLFVTPTGMEGVDRRRTDRRQSK